MFPFGLLTTAYCRGPLHGQACWWSHVHHFRASCQIWPCSASVARHPGSGAFIRRPGGLLLARMMNGGVRDCVSRGGERSSRGRHNSWPSIPGFRPCPLQPQGVFLENKPL